MILCIRRRLAGDVIADPVRLELDRLGSFSKVTINPGKFVYPACKGSVFAYELLNPTDDTIQFVDEIRVITMLPKRGHKSSIIPDGAVHFSTETFEDS